MKTTLRNYRDENDYWRWHFILTCKICDSVEKVTTLWETEADQIAAVLHSFGGGEIRLHVHPQFRTLALEAEMLAHAAEHLSCEHQAGRRIVYLPVFSDDLLRQEALVACGYIKGDGKSHHWRRDLDTPPPETPIAPGYVIRSMGTIDEHPARSWASWRSFHSDEPDENYDGDWSWYQNLQAAPLYRRDLDIVAAAPDGSIAAFCTIFYDDYTRSAVSVLVGTAAEHWRRGLGKAVLAEGMRRLSKLGCTRLFATAYDPPADALYRSMFQNMQIAETWYKELSPS